MVFIMLGKKGPSLQIVINTLGQETYSSFKKKHELNVK
jgi:hypothetical protein